MAQRSLQHIRSDIHDYTAVLVKRLRINGKGRVAVGCDADLVLVDLAERYTLLPEQLRYRHRHSPFAGMTFAGKPRRTILRGETIAIDGEPVGAPRGRLIRPQTVSF